MASANACSSSLSILNEHRNVNFDSYHSRNSSPSFSLHVPYPSLKKLQSHGIRFKSISRAGHGISSLNFSKKHSKFRLSSFRSSSENPNEKTEPNRQEIVYNPKAKIEEYTRKLSEEGFASSPSNLTVFSPCKINVFLRITGKRMDGYHDLSSLFHTISLGDTIKFSFSPSSQRDFLTTNVFGIPLDDKNLIIKALNLYREKTGFDKYFWIHLDKQVPSGAGLGGGSGNAASALWAVNQMNGNAVSEPELQAWSAEIGSDIPFFFSQGAAMCTGRGEIVEDLKFPIPLDTPLVLIKPPQECSTKDVYGKFKLELASSANPNDLLQKIKDFGISQSVCINDLEPPAFEVLPLLKQLKQNILMNSRGKYSAVLMSGSGSTIVAIGDYEVPSFLYDDDDNGRYDDYFIAEANFICREKNEWYKPQPNLLQLNEQDYEESFPLDALKLDSKYKL